MQLPFVLVGINCISGIWGGWAIRAVRTTVVFPSVQWFVWIHWDELFKTRDREKTATNKRATAWVGKFRHGWWRKDKIDWNLLEITTSQLSNFWFLSCAFRWLCGRFRSSLRSRIGIASKKQMSTRWCPILDGFETWRHSEKTVFVVIFMPLTRTFWNRRQ